MAKTEEPNLLIEHLPPQRATLRLAVVTETYPPEINGVAMTLSTLVRTLGQRGHNIQLIRPSQQADSGHAQTVFDQLLTRGMPIPRYPHLRLGLPAKNRLISSWTQHRPDVVHIATEGPLGWSALKAARKLRLPVSSDFRTHFEAYSGHYGLGWLKKPIESYLRKFHNQAHCTLAPTARLREGLMRARFERVQVVGRGIDTQAFNPRHRSDSLRQSWGVANHQPVALYVGRLAPEKNLPLLVRVVQATLAAQPEMKWVIVGEGPGHAELQQAIPQAHFAGARSGQELAAHYASADWFAFPSLTETYGNVVPEALASGLAVVAFDRAAAAELIVPEANGVLVSPSDGDAFVHAALRLSTSPETLGRMRSVAPLSVQHRSWEAITDQMEAIWFGLLLSQPSTEGLRAGGQPMTETLA